MQALWIAAATAVALAADAFAVSIALSTREPSRQEVAAWVVVVGVMHALMAGLGLLLGTTLMALFSWVATWGAPTILVVIAANMLREAAATDDESDDEKEGEHNDAAPPSTSWASLLGLGLATSVDAFGVGFSLPSLVPTPWPTVALIAAVAALGAWVGSRFGRLLSARFGPGVEVAGALLLVAIAGRIIWTAVTT